MKQKNETYYLKDIENLNKKYSMLNEAIKSMQKSINDEYDTHYGEKRGPKMTKKELMEAVSKAINEISDKKKAEFVNGRERQWLGKTGYTFSDAYYRRYGKNKKNALDRMRYFAGDKAGKIDDEYMDMDNDDEHKKEYMKYREPSTLDKSLWNKKMRKEKPRD